MEKILVLQLNRLGDLVQTLPLLRRLHNQYPDREISLVCLPSLVTLIESCSYIHRIIAISDSDLGSFLSEVYPNENANLRDKWFKRFPHFFDHYRISINITNDLNSAILIQHISADKKLGRIHTIEGEIRLLGPWAKYLFAMVGHRMENLFNIVDIQMGIAGLDFHQEKNSLEIRKSEFEKMESRLILLGRNPEKTLVAIQTGASQLHRAWALENFAWLAKELIEKDQIEILLVGDSSEKSRAENLIDRIGYSSSIFNLVGETTLRQLPAALKCCSLLISNDTGTIHIAAAVGTKTLGLFFSTAYFSETAPYGEGHIIMQVEIPCAPCNASNLCPKQNCREFLLPEAVYATTSWQLENLTDNENLTDSTKSFSPNFPWPNLSLYRSQFLSNGMLIYLPFLRPPSTHYQPALFGRLLWEGAMDLITDPILNDLVNDSHTNIGEAFQQIEKTNSTLISMGATFSQGLNLARKIRQEFSELEPRRERILMLHEQLKMLTQSLSDIASHGNLIGAFFNFEMMDLEFASYPKMAQLLEEKYAALLEWSNRFQKSALALTRH